ncbi:dipeptidase PepE [Saccharopolyspora erythraea]|uniref:dipeptidase PepE n=1 Tax=Saccharopolyspora erythraea TaxID=1836 RepID=UPI001BAA645F|nr:dipeptidase PepE [Saccharopolyspora erythraea]
MEPAAGLSRKGKDVELLLLSSSTTHTSTFLGYALEAVSRWLDGRDRLVFVPYAKREHDAYTDAVREALRPLGVRVEGLHRAGDPVAAVRESEAVFVGGGNTFRLLSALYARDLVAALREAVGDRTRYMGSSAGTNMACPTLRTSNDMPIVQPPSFDALGLVPFQINPHYLDPDPAGTHMGETREERIAEFLEENDVPVLGVREGSWVRVSGERAKLGGAAGARLFTRGAEPRELTAGADLSCLLGERPRYDLG